MSGTQRSARRNARSLRKQSMVSMTTKAGFRAQARAAMAAPRSAAVRRSSPSLVGASESALATTRKSLYNRNATCGSRMIGHVDPRSQLRSQGPVSCRAASYDYDVCIIGCGVGGHGAALHAVQQGTSSPSFLSGSPLIPDSNFFWFSLSLSACLTGWLAGCVWCCPA